jgi:hypothetical protein
MLSYVDNAEQATFSKFVIEKGDSNFKRKIFYYIDHNFETYQVICLLSFPDQDDFDNGSKKFITLVEKVMNKLKVKIYDIQDVIRRAVEVFIDHHKALLWLNTPNNELGGETPYDVMGSPEGNQIVLSLVDRVTLHDLVE